MFMITSFGFSQTTSSTMSGTITDQDDAPIQSVKIYTKYAPTGSSSGALTNDKGFFAINNLNPGGPYSIKITGMGVMDTTFTDVYINLGDDYRLNVKLKSKTQNIKDVTVKTPKQNGKITQEQIQTLPTLSRNLSDFNKLTPQSSNNSFNGTNFRYNNITLDGSINNDAIGFSPSLGGMSGTANMPGSSTRTSPISLDAISDMQVVIAPYDVKLGNFVGGSINAVTRSGTNNLNTSVYSYGRGSIITGPDNVGNGARIPSGYYDYQTGFRVGLPLKKDKLFLFVNSEVTNRNEPLFYGAGDNGTFMTKELAKRIVDSLGSQTFMPTSQFNPRGTYNPGAYEDYSIYSKSVKFFTRFDWNINDNNKLTVRTNFISSSATNLERSANEFQFGGYDFTQKNINSSTVTELKSKISEKLSNNFIGGFTFIKDYREPSGDLFPQIQINNVNGSGRILLGSNREAGVFNMGQKTIEITNNLTYLYNKHKFTLGTHNELYNIDYGFINSYNGRIDYNTLDDFFTNKPARIRATYNLNDNSRDYNFNHPSAQFNIFLTSLYLQDDWSITKNLKVSPGIRIDYPILPTLPSTDTNVFLNTYTPNYGTTYTHTQISDIENKFFGKPMVSPRLGFNWDIKNDKKYIVRGGSGIFTGRIPFAWIGYAFYNNGTTYGSFDIKNKPTNIPTDPTQFSSFNTSMGQISRTEINLVDNNFKMPQVWRSSLATDLNISGYRLTLEGIFTKTIYDVMFQQLNLKDSVHYVDYDVNHQQPLYYGGRNDNDYTSIFLLTNTRKGYRYSLTAQLKKDFDFGLNTMVAYNFGKSFDVSNGVRNSYESNWQLNQALSPNNPQLAFSNFDIRHRIVSSTAYKLNWNKTNKTTISLFFTSQSGSPFTWVNGNNKVTANGQQIDLAFICNDPSKFSSVENWNLWNDFVSNNPYLNSRRGQFTERNGARTPWNTQLDLRMIHDIKVKKHNLQITLDVVNLTNLINPKWGWQYFVSNTQNQSAYLGLSQTTTNGVTTFTFTKPTTTPYTVDKLASRWQSQLGLRWTF